MRILLLTQWFTPEPTPKGLQFAQALADLGHDVEVVTGFPNYPGGKLYSGYRIILVRREEIGNITLIRLPLYPSHDRSMIRRSLNYLSFALSAAAYLLFRRRRVDVVYAYHPPLTVPLVALTAKLFRRTPVVVDVQDLWPDTLAATGMVDKGIVTSVLGWLSRVVYRHADRICVLSRGFAREIGGRSGNPGKIHVIPNWAICEPEAPVEAVASREGFRVLFAGNMGPAQDLLRVLEAAEILQKRCNGTAPYFVFLGDGISLAMLMQEAESRGLKNVHFLPRIAADEAVKVLQSHDVLLVHLRDDPLFRITIPSKTQAYLAAGRPLIMAVSGDAAELVEQANAGIVVAPGDPAALADAVLRLASMTEEERNIMGQAARNFYHKHLSLAVGAQKFAAVMLAAAREARVPWKTAS